ncbi:MAG: type I-U CRISPR-associated protein Cas5/Cas6 [Planctomycetota bacterium]|nr:MAG: type I-U CRISPR-associated protein Cas5/Cas6 [Planctomycetota bacterium]REK40306.1 MAG: type I-U CRISPR-associated protein Cas5/Cas6 [Planctomycetota bacterium]
MSSLTIAWEYLTGYAVATDAGNLTQPEWPPHPARVFMALAAAWFETDEDAEEGKALRWLEALGDPVLSLPEREDVFERSQVMLYVPVNDRTDASVAILQSAPSLTRSRQPRSMPRTWVGNATCYMHWPEAGDADAYRQGLKQLCSKVSRIGHSSSLVRMWVVEAEELPNGKHECLLPADNPLDAATHLRCATTGLLDVLPVQTGIPRIEKFAVLDQICRTTNGEDAKSAKAEYEKEFGEKWKKSSSKPPGLGRPVVRHERPYVRQRWQADSPAASSYFDTDMLVLRYQAGPRLPVTSTLAVTKVLRKAVMDECPDPLPKWIAGHNGDSSPLTDSEGHVAYVPLANVGHQHADGSLLGLAILFPRAWADRRGRGRALSPLVMGTGRRPKDIVLTLGSLGIWQLTKTDYSEQRHTLLAETWTAFPKGSQVWASATPVVLDRFPKTDRAKDRESWLAEVADTIAKSCEQIQLPRPIHVEIDTTCWLRGSPRAIIKQRRLRGHSGSHNATKLGDGFPAYPAKGTNASRPQVHVRLVFGQPVVGPLSIGAGRFFGYGFCKPLGGLTE